eukprot:UN24025
MTAVTDSETNHTFYYEHGDVISMYTGEQGHVITSVDIQPTTCPENNYVMNHRCNPCSPGKSSPAGYDPLGPNKWCSPIICEENEYVDDYACHPCHPGYKSPGGDKATKGDTLCEPIICHTNEKVVDHKCHPCQPGYKNIAGDRAAGDDTFCHDASLVCRYEAIEEEECEPLGCEGPDEVACLQSGLDSIVCPDALIPSDRRNLMGGIECPECDEDIEDDNIIEASLFCDAFMDGSDRRDLLAAGNTNDSLNPFFQFDSDCEYMMVDFDCGLQQCPHDVYDESLEDDTLCELDMHNFNFASSKHPIVDMNSAAFSAMAKQFYERHEDVIGNCGQFDVYRKTCKTIEIITINIFWYLPSLDLEQCLFVLDTGLLHQAFANWTGLEVENIYLECLLGEEDYPGETRRELKRSEAKHNEHGHGKFTQEIDK